MADYEQQSSLDRKLRSSSSFENVLPGRFRPLSAQRPLVDALQSQPGRDGMAARSRDAFYKHQNHATNFQESSQNATHFGALPPSRRADRRFNDPQADHVFPEQPATYHPPDANSEQRSSNAKKGRTPWSSKELELSIINESMVKDRRPSRDSFVDICDETPLVAACIDKTKRKTKKEIKREAAVVGATAAGGTAVVGVAAHSAGAMATSAAGSCCCVGACVKSVSVVMFVSVVVGVGYAGFNGVVTALHQNAMTTEGIWEPTSFTTNVETTTFGIKSTTDVPAPLQCPFSGTPTRESLLNITLFDDGRCNETNNGCHPSETSCKEFYECENNQLIGEGECPDDEYFSPNSRSCEFQNGGYYRDALDCHAFHRCAHTFVRTDGNCTEMEYYHVRNPVAPVCAHKDDVLDCPWDLKTTNTPESSSTLS